MALWWTFAFEVGSISVMSTPIPLLLSAVLLLGIHPFLAAGLFRPFLEVGSWCSTRSHLLRLVRVFAALANWLGSAECALVSEEVERRLGVRGCLERLRYRCLVLLHC